MRHLLHRTFPCLAFAALAYRLALLCFACLLFPPLSVADDLGGSPAPVSSATVWLSPSRTAIDSAISSLPLLDEGATWNSPGSQILDSQEAAVVLDFSQPKEVRALILQADNNDSYRVEGSLDGANWQPLTLIPPIYEARGLRSRFAELPHAARYRYIRARAGQGDGNFAVSRLLVLDEIPSWWEPLRQSRGIPLPFIPFLTEARVDALRPFIAAFGLIALLCCAVFRRCSGAERPMRAAHKALGVTAALAFCCWWNFFNFHYPRPVHYWDFYHYYMGAKYFPQVGYTGLYDCTAQADIDDGLSEQTLHARMRSLRTNLLLPTTEVLKDSQCKQQFTSEGWDAFRRDVSWFRLRMAPARWLELRQDHGYNGTPVWRLLPAAIISILPLTDQSVLLLAHVDSLFLCIAWLMVLWGFGFEAACAAVLFWGTNIPGRFFWTGGSLFRHDWLCWIMLSLCCMKRGKSALSGALLAYATALRIFPGFILLGPLSRFLARCLRERRLRFERLELRFAFGFFIALAALGLLGHLQSGRSDSYREFAANSVKHLATPLTNNMGLSFVVSFHLEQRGELTKESLSTEPYGPWKQLRLESLGSRVWLLRGVQAVYLLLLIAACSRLPLWAALVLGSTAIPIFTELTCYYYSFLSVAALLWAVTPLAGIGLALASFLTALCFQWFEWYDVQYTAMSLIVVAFCLAMVGYLSRSTTNLGKGNEP